MKTIVNRRFLIGFVIGALLLGAAVQGLHAIQINRQSRFLLDEAHRARKEENFELAVNRFQQYLNLAPKDSDAMAEFGLLLAEHHLAREATVLLENVLRSQPNRDDLRRPLAVLEMQIGRWNDARTHLRRLLANSPGDAVFYDLLATCQAAGGEFGPAIASLQKSIDCNPRQVEAYQHLAEVLRQLQRPVEADAWMQKLIEANPKSARAHMLDGEYLAGVGREEEARAQAERAMELAPTDAKSLLLAARLASRKAPYGKAQDYARRAIDSAPRNASGYITLARLETLSGDRKKAIACLETGAEQTRSRDADLLWELGRLRIEAGELAEAEEIIDTLRKLPSDDRIEPLIGYLESQIEVANGHWPAAIERLDQVAAQLGQSPDLLREVRYQTAACHERLGNTELELAAYREAARVDPAWPPAQLGIASTLLALGKFDEALEQYRRIAKLDGMAAAGAVGQVRLLILKNLARAPAEQDWIEVDRLFDQLGRSNPDAVGVILLRSEALAGRQQSANAEQLLLAARTKFPDRIEVWTALVGLADREQHWSRAEQILAEADTKFGDQVWLRLARGSYLRSRYKLESAAKLQALGVENKAFGPDDRLKLDRGLATLSLEAGAGAQATELRAEFAADPKNLAARLFLFDLALGNGDTARVKQVVEEIRSLEGEGPFWHYGQAALCVLTKPATAALDAAAIQHIGAARKLRPGWSALSLLTAQIQDRQGQSGPALQSYLEAIELGEPSTVAVRRAVELLYAGQRYTEADQLLRRLEQQPTLFSGEVERLASKVSARMDDLDRALELARKVAADSSDWQDQVWLGQLQSLLGLRDKDAGRAAEAGNRFADAEISLRRAVELKPEAPEPWVALIRFFAAIDRKSDAEAAVRKAADKLSAQTAALALAACYEAIGNTAEAAKQYQSALSQRAADAMVVRRVAEFEIRSGKLTDAEAHLRKIVSGQLAAEPDDIASARRALAGVLLASGNYLKLQQALALVEQNVAAGAAAADLREKALILAVSPQLQRRREAIGILERLLPTQTDADDLRVALAQLYLAEKDWPHAAGLLRNLATSHEQDPRYVAAYTVRLLERQETDEAELWIRRLEQIAPNEFTTVSLKAQALVQRAQSDAAIQALRDSLARPKLSAAEAGAQTQMSAARLEELARGTIGPDQSTAAGKLLAEAERLYRKYVKEQPGQQIVLAAFLGRRGRFDESLSLVETAQSTAEPKELAETYVGLMESGPAWTGPGRRLEKLLLAAISQHGDTVELRIALAELRERQERIGNAEAIYREKVLAKDASNVVAMNNLATLLALQKKQVDEAQRMIEQAIATAGPLPALLDSRATVFLALGKPREALTDLDQALSAEPQPNRQFHRALACFQLGQIQDAIQALNEARKLGLVPEKLNPLERAAYQDLSAELQRRGG